MLIHRSAVCSLKFATQAKLEKLREILAEYGRVVNIFIEHFWQKCPDKVELLKPIVDLPADSWLSARLRKVAAREAVDMVTAMRRSGGNKPVHRGKRMHLGSTIASFQAANASGEFDGWLVLTSIGRKLRQDLPIRLHRQFKRLHDRGHRLESYILTETSVQFVFEIETGPKRPPNRCLGVDTGINALASVSSGRQYGTGIKSAVDRVKRCRHGSCGQRRARRALRQQIDETAKELLAVEQPTLLVAENLSGITLKTRRRLGSNMRRSVGSWNVRYWMVRLKERCEDNRVAFRTVSPAFTSQTCSRCGHTDRRNRQGAMFKCLSCGHEANADVQASTNILSRFLSGPYGAGCQAIPAGSTGAN